MSTGAELPWIAAAAAERDVRQLAKRFVEENDELSFAGFKRTWLELGFGRIHLARHGDEDQVAFLESLYAAATVVALHSDDSTALGVAFAIFALQRTSPGKIIVPVPMTPYLQARFERLLRWTEERDHKVGVAVVSGILDGSICPVRHTIDLKHGGAYVSSCSPVQEPEAAAAARADKVAVLTDEARTLLGVAPNNGATGLTDEGFETILEQLQAAKLARYALMYGDVPDEDVRSRQAIVQALVNKSWISQPNVTGTVADDSACFSAPPDPSDMDFAVQSQNIVSALRLLENSERPSFLNVSNGGSHS